MTEGMSRQEAEAIERMNLGYFAAYYSGETRVVDVLVRKLGGDWHVEDLRRWRSAELARKRGLLE